MKTTKTKLYFMITFFLFFTLTVLLRCFAQGALAQPSVRLVYFLPNDRPDRPERVKALKALILEAQEFYADEMERHGFGRKTFRIETDRNGEPIVHRFNGRFNEHHYYQRLTDFSVWQEFYQKINDIQHVYFIAIDLSSEILNEGESCGLGGVTFFPSGENALGWSFGSGAVRHRDEIQSEAVLGGSAIIPVSGPCFFDDVYTHNHPLRVTTHELAHTFGLDHDFSDLDSAVGGRGFRFSQCDAEWLSVSRYFNSKLDSKNVPGDIQLISPPTYSAEGITLRFEVTDADGLHQAQLLVPEDGSWGPWKLIGCQKLDGHRQTVEFVTTELVTTPVERVMLQFVDDLGTITWATILTDIASIVPPPKVVSIPDRNLAAAVREGLGLDRNARITDRVIGRLRSLNANDRQIKNLAGLEHATQLTWLNLGRNQINNYDPLAQLPKLARLYLWANGINDLSVLPPMSQLEFLDINWNQIDDLSPLTGFTNLKELWLQGNKLSDTSTLFQLHNGTFPPDEEIEVMEERDNAGRAYTLLTFRSLDLEVRVNPNVIVYRSLNAVQSAQDPHAATKKAVPTTGTWFAVEKPAGLTPADFTIRPGEFVILAHRGKQVTTRQARVKTYVSYYAFNSKANDFPNLANLFKNGGRIELVSHATLNPLPRNTRKPKFGDLVISEILWGLNARSPGKQYIEIYNASQQTYTFTDGDLSLRFSKTSAAPLPDEVFPLPSNPNAELKVIDRISNDGWKVPGQSGNLSKNVPLVSMYRTLNYTTGVAPDGTLASAWKKSIGRVNLSPPSLGTPGAKYLTPGPIVHLPSTQRPSMYWVDPSTRKLSRLVGTHVETFFIPSVRDVTGLAVDSINGKIYWTEKTSERVGRVRSVNLDGTNVQLVKSLTSVPLSITLDTTVNRKIYLTNAWGKIQRLNFDGSNFQPNFITGLESPKNIAVDVAGEKLYWTEQTSDTTGKIRRADLDGSNVQLVKDLTSVPQNIALDTINRKIYLTNTGGKVQRLNFNGSNFQPNFIKGLESPEGIAVDAVNRKLYWTEKASISRANLNGKNIENIVTGLNAPANIALGIMQTGVAIAAAPSTVIAIPDETALHSNYPNPFNPETWIPYQLTKPADVTLRIYAANGALVRTLTLGHQPAGIYHSRSRAAYWDGKNELGENVASGIYFYTLSAGVFTATRKMLIVK